MTEIQIEEQQEEAMRHAFREQTRAVLTRSDDFRKTEKTFLTGVEIELGLIHEDLSQPAQQIRNVVIHSCGSMASTELGAAQVELHTDPLDILTAGPSVLLSEIDCISQVAIQQARIQGVRAVFHGTNPFIDPSKIVRTNKPKYTLVPNFHDERRRERMVRLGEISHVGADIVSLTNSVQTNVEAKNEVDAVDKLNRSFQIGPMVVALTANARFFGGMDTGMQDIRMDAWERTHDTRTQVELQSGALTRVGLPTHYYESLGDYFDEIAKQPFILFDPDHALPIGIGLNWQDARIKVLGNSLVVEFRPVSTQASAQENFSACMFYLGRLFWSQQHVENILPLEYVRENRNSAMQKGTTGQLWVQSQSGFAHLATQVALEIELERAKNGLIGAQMWDETVSNTFELLLGQIYQPCPSERINTLYRQASDSHDLFALREALITTGGLK